MEKGKTDIELEETLATQRRPQTVQNANNNGFPNIPLVKEASDYIFITQEILDAFKERLVKSHKVNLNWQPHRKKDISKGSSKSGSSFSSLSGKFRFLHDKANTCLGFKEMTLRRPVRVFVDDITQRQTAPCADQVECLRTDACKRNRRKHKRQHASRQSSDVGVKR